ncbi:hypothetical protein BC938DRAFT_479775 [Jimgerdemannia flammicorona]|uniref:Uncharacterized protein n=1 Tax=Jimgerdemannia flammicorona TaxID=994334 RepID=A0A433QK66_9FUNG|nr:hypothetical protein BC938DRAFT_479775 [Jimgerdemannia flammicorona]
MTQTHTSKGLLPNLRQREPTQHLVYHRRCTAELLDIIESAAFDANIPSLTAGIPNTMRLSEGIGGWS